MKAKILLVTERYSIFDTGFSMLDTGYWMLDARYWMLDAAILHLQIFLSFIEYRESNIEYLLVYYQESTSLYHKLLLFFQHFSKHRHHLKQIADNPVIAFAEYGCVFVGVDGHDDLGRFHTRKMLHRPGKPAADV